MKNNLKIIWAFLKKDFLTNCSYKLSFLMDFSTILFTVLTFFFISRVFGGKSSGLLNGYGGNYFAFVLVGLAFYELIFTAMNSFLQVLIEEQHNGSLEYILMTPLKVFRLLLFGSTWNVLMLVAKISFYFLVARIFLGFDFGAVNLPAVIVIALATVIIFVSLGLVSAGFTLVFKRGNPINWLFEGASRLLGGLYFPIAILPHWMQKISHLLPVTYSLEAMRNALLQGATLQELRFPICVLAGFGILLLPLGMLAFNFSLKAAKKHGSLAHC